MINTKKGINSNRRQRVFWIVMAIFISVVIFIFSSQSTKQSEDLTDAIADPFNIEQKGTEIRVSSEKLFLGLTLRKIAPVFLYALLGFSLYFAFDGIRGRVFWAIGAGFVGGGLDQLHQMWEGRYGRWEDTLIDFAAILLGIGLAVLAVFLLRTLRKAFEKAEPKRLVQIERVLDGLSLATVMHYAFYRFLHSTMFSFYYPTIYKAATVLILLLAGGVRFLYLVLKKCWSDPEPETWSFLFLRYALAFCLAIPFVYVGLLHNYKWLIPIPFAVMCLYDMDTQKICRAFVVTMGILVAALVLCCLSGTVRNLVFQGARLIGAFGTINTTDFGSYFSFLLITAWCALRNRKWYTSILFSAIAVGVTYLVWWYTDSRTVYYSGILLVIFTLWDCIEENIFKKNKKLRFIGKSINWLSPMAFPLIGGFLFWLVIRFGALDSWAQELDASLLSYRLVTVWNPLCTYGVKPFGSTLISTHGHGGTLISAWRNGYGYIDVAYGMLVIQFGWVITAIVTGMWVWTTVKALRHGNNRIAFAMVILAFHALSETRVLDLNYNIFLAMPFCAMAAPEKSLQAETQKIKMEKPIWAPILVGTVVVGGVYLLLPRGLSWLRTFFALKGWNSGTAAFSSLAFCVALLLMLWLLWKALYMFLIFRNKTHIAFLAGVIFFLAGSLLMINGTIEKGLEERADQLKEEIPVVAQVQEVATMPVYAAEQGELYRRSGVNNFDEFFSMEELTRSLQGSLFVGRDIEMLEIFEYRGLIKYTQFSEWSGLYSYDPAVIEAFANLGYEWKSYYSGKRSVNLRDTALFNGKTPEADSLSLIEGERVETKNMMTDFFAGTYEVCFSLSSLQITEQYSNNQDPLWDSEGMNPWKDKAVCLEVVGEDGDAIIYQEWLPVDAFDENGKCTAKLTYSNTHCPMVYFAVETAENVRITIEDISWQRIS